jgi:hypothetical protein
VTRRLALVALAAVLASVASLTGAAAGAGRQAVAYVALGDSFSSGEGISPYLGAGRCDRSTRAYAEFVQPPGLGAPAYAVASGGGAAGPGNRYGSDANVRSAGDVSWSFWACSGARTRNVLPRALGGVGQGAGWETSPQLDSVDISKATLVTMTIGGNDAGYVDVLMQCGLFRCNTAAFRAQRQAVVDGVRPQVQKVVEAVAAKAPGARILVLGYPQVFPATKAEQRCAGLRPFAGEMDMLRGLGDRLNVTIARAVADAAAHGVNATFVPVAPRFAGHEVCGRKGAWINGVLPARTAIGIDPGSFHPTLRGQRDGYAAAVNAALR